MTLSTPNPELPARHVPVGVPHVAVRGGVTPKLRRAVSPDGLQTARPSLGYGTTIIRALRAFGYSVVPDVIEMPEEWLSNR